MKKWQIMRMFSGRQQTFNRDEKKWQISNDRWSDTFEATPEQARDVFKEAITGFRKVGNVSTPKLHEII